MANVDAENFVMSYYEMLQNNPENVRPFFLDNSIMVRIDGDMHALANTVPDIMEILGSLGNVIFEMKSKESLPYINGGFIVQVSGLVHVNTFKEQRKFREIFFLAFRQNEYLIHRDIFECDVEHLDVMSDDSSKEFLEVAQEIVALSSSPLREPPTMDVASTDGASSVNSGEDTQLHIGNLPKGYDNAEVAELVRQVASPVLVQVGHAKRKSRKGYAFVTMETVEERDLVIAHLNGKECSSGVLKASVALNHNPKEEKREQLIVREVASPVLVQVSHAKKKQRKGYAFVTMETVEERDLVIAHLKWKECGGGVLIASVTLNHNPKMDSHSQHSKAR